ncbi:MAG TPA: RES family NAD+ phosphorylase [Thermomicrobiales bacterium]|nr:RES family NAD+ phosphorylase [Thermomicrobiales bacterium]
MADAPREAAPPAAPLHRLGRAPDPLAWPLWAYVGTGRFDDPAGRFRVLYVAEQRRAAFAETLAQFRPSLAVLAAERAVTGADEPPPPARGVVPLNWLAKRATRRLRLGSDQRWLDLRAPETRAVLRAILAPTLQRLGLPDLDVGAVYGPSRAFTQVIARWAYEAGYQGLAYGSRHDERFTNWALFEGAVFTPDGLPTPLMRDDPDLRAVAALFGLDV